VKDRLNKRGGALHYKVRLNVNLLPEHLKLVLEKLKKERCLVLKGGIARLSLLETLRARGKSIKADRLARERGVKDLDIILVHFGTLPKSKDWLLEKEKEIREKLDEKRIVLMGEDIEPIRGTVHEDGKITEETIEKILETRDLTINEVILVPEEGAWYIYYTQRCWRDLILGIGIINARDPKLTRRDCGRIILSSRAIYRLLKFLVEGKIEKIYFPEWQRIAHLVEMLRRQTKGELPQGANLGRYSLIIVHKYKDSDVQIKGRWMRVLTGFGFTEIWDFDKFAAEQKIFDSLKSNGDFQFESDLSFAQIIDRLISERAQREEARHQRKVERNECVHQFENIPCQGCSVQCLFQKCQKCTKYRMVKPTLQTLPCNRIFLSANWRADEKSLREFPGKF